MVQMWFMPKMRSSYHDRSSQIWSVVKTRQDNNVTHSISLVYIENNIELSRPIGSGEIYDETRQHNDVIDLPCVVYTENETELS